nr:MAG TPA: hypothetical protein [Bacteriophage sp.]
MFNILDMRNVLTFNKFSIDVRVSTFKLFFF